MVYTLVALRAALRAPSFFKGFDFDVEKWSRRTRRADRGNVKFAGGQS